MPFNMTNFVKFAKAVTLKLVFEDASAEFDSHGLVAGGVGQAVQGMTETMQHAAEKDNTHFFIIQLYIPYDVSNKHSFLRTQKYAFYHGCLVLSAYLYPAVQIL